MRQYLAWEEQCLRLPGTTNSTSPMGLKIMWKATLEVLATFLFFVMGNDFVETISESLTVVDRFVTVPVTFRCWPFFFSSRYFFMRALRDIMVL